MPIEQILDAVFAAVVESRTYQPIADRLAGTTVTAHGVIKAVNLEASALVGPRIAIRLRPEWQRNAEGCSLKCSTLTVFVDSEDIEHWAETTPGDEVQFSFTLRSIGPTPCLWIDSRSNLVLNCREGKIIEASSSNALPSPIRRITNALLVSRRFTDAQDNKKVASFHWTVRRLSAYVDVQYSLRTDEIIHKEHIVSFWNEVENQILSTGATTPIKAILADLMFESGELICTIECGDPTHDVCVCLVADEFRWSRYIKADVGHSCSSAFIERVWDRILPPDECPFTLDFFLQTKRRNCKKMTCTVGAEPTEQVEYQW